MNPILTVEFSARLGDQPIKEESVALHSPEELFRFVGPGGGCEAIPDEVAEVRLMFLPPARRNSGNPMADAPATLQMGIVLITGPLAELVQTAEKLIDKAGRGELSESFRRVLHLTS